MPEYIDREELLKRNMFGNTNPITHRTYAKNLIESAPAADVVEVKHGKWELHGNDDSLGCSYFCSSCWWNIDEDEFLDNWSHFKYCPNCGAKMDLKEGAE